MKQVSRRAGACAATLLGVMAAGGCAEEETGLYIRGNVLLDAPECIARAEGNTTLLITGFLDVALRPDYEATLLVGSQLTPRGDKANLRSETMITTITGAEVQLYDDTGALTTEFTVPATGVIQPSSSEEAGFGVITATLIPAATGIALANELSNPAEVRTRVAEARVFGTTIGGVDVESAPFSYVIRVCEGCLVDFPADAFSPVEGCLPGGSTQGVAAPCRFGQDSAVDCRLCVGENPYCQFPGGGL